MFVLESDDKRTYLLKNDIAIIKLAESVEFSDTLYPICLAKEVTLEVGDDAMSVGYGEYTDNANEPIQENGKLRAVYVPVRPCKDGSDSICIGNNKVGVEGVSKISLEHLLPLSKIDSLSKLVLLLYSGTN